jgi:hypothetical protein
MQITIDSNEPLTKVLPVISALYGVDLSVPTQAVDDAPARRTRSPRAKQAGGRRSKRAEVKASAVREWARSNGHQVSDRGRVAAGLVEAYRAAN